MFGIYTKETADAIFKFYADQINVGGVSKKPDSSWQPLWYFVKLTEALDVATDSETGYTQATADVVKYSNTADDLDMEVAVGDDVEITVTNRNTSFSGAIDEYLWVVQPYGVSEFIPLVSNKQRLQVTLDEDLFSPSDWKTSEETAICSVWAKDTDGRMFNTGRKITVVNRFEGIELAKATIAKAEWIEGEWQIYAADCGTDGGSSSDAYTSDASSSDASTGDA